jgi:hypothetical protein
MGREWQPWVATGWRSVTRFYRRWRCNALHDNACVAVHLRGFLGVNLLYFLY